MRAYRLCLPPTPYYQTERQKVTATVAAGLRLVTGAAVYGREVRVIVMHAQVGDRLVVGHDRVGVVIGVPAADGSPPYVVKWLKGGNIALVRPDQYSRIVPAGQPVNAAPRPEDTP